MNDIANARIDTIVIGERHRKSLGRIEELAGSIAQLGLLQPIGIDASRRQVQNRFRTSRAFLLPESEAPAWAIAIYERGHDPCPPRGGRPREGVNASDLAANQEQPGATGNLERRHGGRALTGLLHLPPLPVRYRHSGAATKAPAARVTTPSLGKRLMARARIIKPGFFLNERLAELHPLTRILFAGLWCNADRLGRLEDRPKKIKAAILPYDDHDIGRALDDLQTGGFISRYRNCEASYIQVLAFDKHQHPHPREAESEIPDPDLGKAKDMPRHGLGSPKDSTSPSGSSGSSGSSFTQDLLSKDVFIQKADEDVDSADGALADAHPAVKKSKGKREAEPPPCPHQAIIDLYHERLPMCPRVREWTRERQRLLTVRWREDPDRQDLKWWDGYFSYVAESRFLTGRTKPNGSNSKPFVASLEWLIRPSNFTKVYEGQYE
jgi:hypothetical protein